MKAQLAQVSFAEPEAGRRLLAGFEETCGSKGKQCGHLEVCPGLLVSQLEDAWGAWT